MNHRKFFQIFFILAVFTWSFSLWGYKIYIRVVDYFSHYRIMQVAIFLYILFVVGYLITQIRILRENGSGSILTKTIRSTIWLLLLMLWVFIVCLFRFPQNVKMLYHPFQFGVPRFLDAEGIEVFFYFVLAFFSGRILYSSLVKVISREFWLIFIAWFIILFVNELGIQNLLCQLNKLSTFFPIRTISIYDIVNNMGGVIIGLVLSLPYFWRKQ